MSKVFSSIQVNSKTLQNRLALAPMTTQQSLSNGHLSPEETAWLQRTAADGYGMVISCAASISPTAIAFHNQLSLADDSMIPALAKLSATMKAEGSINIIQLCHAGSRAIESLTGEQAHSAGSYTLPMIKDFVPPQALSVSQINHIIQDFVTASERAHRAGFDGVELHGANGYLFTQFFSTMTNLRDDEYGGGLANRARFAREVVKACRAKVPNDFIIGFRISFENMGLENGLDIDENIQIINWLAEDGIDYVHTSHLFYTATTQKYPDTMALSYLRQHITAKLPLVGVGGIVTVEDAEKAMELGADIVAIGRAAIANKNLPTYFKNRQALPYHTPYQEEQLKEAGISQHFIDYLKYAPPLASLHIVSK